MAGPNSIILAPMRRGPAQVVLVVALAAAAAGAYWWWARPERQIRALLRDAGAALTSEPGESSLATLAGVAALEEHLASDVSIAPADSAPIQGRDAVITAAARYRARNPVLVRFFDPEITFDSEDEATVVVTAEVTTRAGTAEGNVEVHQVTATVKRSERRWVVSTARSDDGPQSGATRLHQREDLVSVGRGRRRAVRGRRREP